MQHAYALELADVAVRNVESPRILDVGAGSGYLTECFGRLVEDEPGARVFGIERIPELSELALQNIRRGGADLLDRGVVSVQRACDYTDWFVVKSGADLVV